MRINKFRIPYFKYHLDPLKTGVIKKEKSLCPVCIQEREYIYKGPFYSVEDVSGICPWCIKNGNAAKKYNGSFQDSYSIDSKSVLNITVKFSVEIQK